MCRDERSGQPSDNVQSKFLKKLYVFFSKNLKEEATKTRKSTTTTREQPLTATATRKILLDTKYRAIVLGHDMSLPRSTILTINDMASHAL